jgi:hypothetical protein
VISIGRIRARSRTPTTIDVSMMSSNAPASEGSSTGVCPDVTTCRGPHRRGQVDRHHLAGHQPVEQMTDRSEPLLDARRGELARADLDPGGDVHRLHGRDRWHAGGGAPGQKFLSGPGVGAARVRVANLGGEEFEEAHRGALAGSGDERR